MFGNKRKKRKRLQHIGVMVRDSRGGISQAELARRLGVSRGTLNKDLSVLQEKAGILLWEDDRGRLNWFE